MKVASTSLERISPGNSRMAMGNEFRTLGSQVISPQPRSNVGSPSRVKGDTGGHAVKAIMQSYHQNEFHSKHKGFVRNSHAGSPVDRLALRNDGNKLMIQDQRLNSLSRLKPNYVNADTLDNYRSLNH